MAAVALRRRQAGGLRPVPGSRPVRGPAGRRGSCGRCGRDSSSYRSSPQSVTHAQSYFAVRGFALRRDESRFCAPKFTLLLSESGSATGLTTASPLGRLFESEPSATTSHQDPNVQHSFLRPPCPARCRLAAAAAPAFAADKSVAVTAIVEHPALDAARDGVRDELKAAGFEAGKNLKFEYQSAQGNNGTAAQIARKYVGERPDVIVAIATPSAQAVVAATQGHPGRLQRRHRPGRRQAGQELGCLGHQRHRRLRPVAAGQAPRADQAGRPERQARRRDLQPRRSQLGGDRRGAEEGRCRPPG